MVRSASVTNGVRRMVNGDDDWVTIVFVTHATSLDNERGLASGWYDTDLSPLGIEQDQELGARYAEERFDAMFCSEQLRAFRTAASQYRTGRSSDARPAASRSLRRPGRSPDA